MKQTVKKNERERSKSKLANKKNGKIGKNNLKGKKHVMRPTEKDTRFDNLPEDSEELRAQFERDFRRQKIRERLKDLSIDYIRGELPLVTDSSSDGSDETDYEDSQIESEQESESEPEPDCDSEKTVEATNRLILQSMDWDNVRAVDLYVLFNSQKPDAGIIESVTIYPSEFGLRRLELEDTKGPFAKLPEEMEAEEAESKRAEKETKKRKRNGRGGGGGGGGDTDGNSELEEYERAVRDYELKKMRYYFAVIVCDSAGTAQAIQSCNQMMFFGANGPMIDLTFLDANETFAMEPKDVCTKMPDKYKPPSNFNDLFSKVKVKLTWDQTDPFRVEFMSRDNYDDVDDSEWSKYIATPSDSDEEIASPPIFDDDVAAAAETKTEKTKRKQDCLVVKEAAKKLTTLEKYRELLKEIDEEERKEKERHEMSFEAAGGDDSEADDEDEVEVDENGRVRMDVVTERWKRKKELRQQQKKKSQGQDGDGDGDGGDMEARRQELELLMDNDESQATSVKKSKNFSVGKLVKSHEAAEKLRGKSTVRGRKKRKLAEVADKEASDPFELDLNDERFADVYSDSFYAINPNDPNFKKTKQMKRLLDEKQKRAKNAA